MSHGALYQHCLCSIAWTVVLVALRSFDWGDSNGVYGDSTPCAYRSGLWGMLVRCVLSGIQRESVLGEIFGTGIIGAVVSYPVMTFLFGKEGLSWLFYVPSFIGGTLIGGSIAFLFLKKLEKIGMLAKCQALLLKEKGGDYDA